MYTNQNNYLQYSCFLSSCHTRNDFFFQFYSFWLILFKYPYCNRIVIVKVIKITGCFAMYSITITITCNHKNQRLQITFWLLKTCNRLHVITITDYNYNRSVKNASWSYDTALMNRLLWAFPVINRWANHFSQSAVHCCLNYTRFTSTYFLLYLSVSLSAISDSGMLYNEYVAFAKALKKNAVQQLSSVSCIIPIITKLSNNIFDNDKSKYCT